VGAESAKIFTVGIRNRGFSLTGGLESFVVAKRDAVRSPESGRADVDLQFFKPKGCVLIAVREARLCVKFLLSPLGDSAACWRGQYPTLKLPTTIKMDRGQLTRTNSTVARSSFGERQRPKRIASVR
jgi:hypothetical protein